MHRLFIAIVTMLLMVGSAFAQMGTGHMGNGNSGAGTHMDGDAGHGMTESGAMGRGHMQNGNTGSGSHMGSGTAEEMRSQKAQRQGSHRRMPQQRGQNPRRR